MQNLRTGMILIFLVDDKSKESLHPKIEHHLLGSTLVSDKMASYVSSRTNVSDLTEMEYIRYYWFNHSNEWVNDIFADIHTNNIERTW